MSEKRNKQIESVIRFNLSNYFVSHADVFGEVIVVSDVEMNDRGTLAKIWVTYESFALKDGEESENYEYIIKRIHKNISSIKRYLADHMEIRRLPEIRFEFDLSGYNAGKIDNILAGLKAKGEL